VGLRDMRQQLRTFPYEMDPAPEQIPSRPPVGRIDVRLWQQASPQEYGNLLSVDLIVFGRAAVDGLHRERVTQDTRPIFVGAAGRQPVPGTEPFDGDDQLLTIGRHSLEEHLRTGLHVAMPQHLAILTQATHVHAARMPIDPAIRFGLFGVQSPCGPLLVRYKGFAYSQHKGFAYSQHTTAVGWGGGLNKYHRRAGDALQRPLRSRFQARLTPGV